MRTVPKVTVDNLAEVIGDILEEYGQDVTNITSDAVRAVAKEGVKAVRSEASRALHTSTPSPYLKGWTSRIEESRTGTVGVIYNADQPGLTHLLENGHVSRNGTGRTFGRVQAYPHIAPVQKILGEQFEKKLKVKL